MSRMLKDGEVIWYPDEKDGFVYDEVDSGDYEMNMGPAGMEKHYAEADVEFEETTCARCKASVGPYAGECEGQYGTVPCEAWITCFVGPLGIICESCAVIVDPGHEDVESMKTRLNIAELDVKLIAKWARDHLCPVEDGDAYPPRMNSDVHEAITRWTIE